MEGIECGGGLILEVGGLLVRVRGVVPADGGGSNCQVRVRNSREKRESVEVLDQGNGGGGV